MLKLVAILVMLAGPAIGAVITVDTSTDPIDIDWQTATIADLPGPDGMASFYEAMIAADNTPGHDTIGLSGDGSVLKGVHLGEVQFGGSNNLATGNSGGIHLIEYGGTGTVIQGNQCGTINLDRSSGNTIGLDAAFVDQLATAVPEGWVVAATATGEPQGATSEFGESVEVAGSVISTVPASLGGPWLNPANPRINIELTRSRAQVVKVRVIPRKLFLDPGLA